MGSIKRTLALILSLSILAVYSQAAEFSPQSVSAIALVNTNIPCESAILIDQESGKILFEKEPDKQMAPASITKIMALLLVMEALESEKISIDDFVTATPHASSMGGSQIWLEPNEQMTVHELLKAAATASANDATVALAEHISGSEDSFVALMNQRANELGMKNTTFINATGLDAPGHLSTARDISIMSTELLKHPKITEYTTIWMDSLRDGETELVNTNKLIRFYDGATGLKTGTTDGAGSCLSASATRDSLTLIAVVLGSDTSDERFGAARGLLDFGFANYEVKATPLPDPPLDPIPVKGGVKRDVGITPLAPSNILLEKGISSEIVQERTLVEEITAPVPEGEIVGNIRLLRDGIVLDEYPLVTSHAVEKITFGSAALIFFEALSELK